MKDANQGEQKYSLSRRGFLSGAGVIAGGVAASTLVPTTAYAEEAEAVEGPKEVRIFDGVDLAIGRVVHDPDICSGCRTCEIVCSVYHEGAASSTLSRIQWDKDVLGACITDIMACKQCAGAECVAVCPNGALHVDAETGARVIDEAVCVGCQLCLNACPVEPKRIRYNREKNVCFKCNLCDGDPQCVKFCPTGSLTSSWVELEKVVEEESIFEVNLVVGEDDARLYTHVESSSLFLNETATGLEAGGIVWTSHATSSNIYLAVFDLTADFYDMNGSLLGSSDEGFHFEIAEMSSSEFLLSWTTSYKAADLGKVVLNISSMNQRNAPTEGE